VSAVGRIPLGPTWSKRFPRGVAPRVVQGLLALLVAGALLAGATARLGHDHARPAAPGQALSTFAAPFQSGALLSGAGASSQHKRELASAVARLPLSFEQNVGQADASAKFLARGAGYSLALTSQGTRLSLADHGKGGSGRDAVLESQFVGGRAAQVSGTGRLPGHVNYLRGDDRANWHTNVATYSGVSYRSVWQGIDVAFYGNQRRLEYDYRLAPGADPSQIGTRLSGARHLRVDRGGDLVIGVRGGAVRQLAPRSYQTVGGERRAVESRYVIHGNRVGIRVGAYDRHLPLVIDPTLSYSTFLGGAGEDIAVGITVDSENNAYIVGHTASEDFPATDGAKQTDHATGLDAYVAKLDASGSSLAYATYLGGNGTDEAGSVTVDPDGDDPDSPSDPDDPEGGVAYVAGVTNSTDFPTTNGVLQGSNATTPGQGSSVFDSFVAKLNEDGSDLYYSTYLGGSKNDTSSGIGIDANDNAYLTGSTTSPSFSVAGSRGTRTDSDGWVAKINAGATSVSWARYLGGTSNDYSYGLARGPGGSYVTGSTSSEDFQDLSGYDTTYGTGDPDDFIGGQAFVAKLQDSSGSRVYATYLGGDDTGSSGANDIAVGSDGSAYVTGSTTSATYPTTGGAAFEDLAGDGDVFVTKLNPAGSALAYSTLLGGSALDAGYGIGVGDEGNAFVTGYTFSKNFFTTDGAEQEKFGGGDGMFATDAFEAELNPAGSEFASSTYLGGAGNDIGYGVAIGPDGDAFIDGSTSSSGFPTSPDALQPEIAGGFDAYVSVDPSRRSTSTSLACGLTQLPVGKPTVCTAYVSDTDSSPTSVPTGNVTFSTNGPGNFSDGGSCELSGSITASCQVSYTPSAKGAGIHKITANYQGDNTHSFSGADSDVNVKGPAEGGGDPGSSSTSGTSGGGGDDDGPGAKPAEADDLGFSSTTFQAADSGPSAEDSKRKIPVGTRVSYKLSKASVVQFTVTRRSSGRKVKRRGHKAQCKAPAKRYRKKPRCTRYVKVKGSFRRSGAKGRNTFRFSGRLSGKKLRPGRYQLVATPIKGTRSGKPITASFRIVR
jgi:Beta-propeller repeat